MQQPFEIVKLAVSSIEDKTWQDSFAPEFGIISDRFISTASLDLNVGLGAKKVALFVDVDQEDVQPVVMRQMGYEWVPVWTRQLVE